MPFDLVSRFTIRAPVVVAAFLAACASVPSLPQSEPEQFPEVADAFLRKHMDECLARYALWDARVAAAGAGDGGWYRVPGHPYLRTERETASFRHELADLETYWSWLSWLRDNDLLARDTEMRNAGASDAERVEAINQMRNCSKWLLDPALVDPAIQRAYREVVVPPDEYAQGAPRLTKALVAAARAQAASVRARFDAVSATESVEKLMRWTVADPDPAGLRRFEQGGFDALGFDLLGRLDMLSDEWAALAALAAPQLLLDIDTRFGAPRWSETGLAVDTDVPVIYWSAGTARVGPRMLWRFTYLAWFPAANGQGADGWIWRQTFDDAGNVVAAESVRADGFGHLWFPGAGTIARDLPEAERALVAEPIPAEDFMVRVARADLTVERLAPLALARDGSRSRYKLRPYAELSSLAAPGGRTRSLFDADGYIADGRVLPLPGGVSTWADSGVPRLGVARQFERLVVAFTARRHFSDPYLLDTLFTVAPIPSAH